MYERISFQQRRPVAGPVNVDQLDITASGQLYHYWPMDVLTSRTPNVIKGTNFDLVTSGGPTLVTPGTIGNAINFLASSSQYAAAATADQGPQSGFSTSCWIKPGSFSAFNSVISKFSVSTPAATYMLLFLSNASPTARVFTDPTNYIERSDVGDLIKVGQLVHLVMTWDGTLPATSISIYRDAVKHDDTSSGSGTFTGAYSGSDLKWTVAAAFNDQAAGTIINPFDGVIDDVRVYNRALLQSEITAIFLAGNNRRP